MAEDFIKKPEYAGLFYSSDPDELKEQIDLNMAKVATLGPDFSDIPLRALVVPSSGFSYCSTTALAAYQKILHRHYKRVVILASSHFFSFQGIALPEEASVETLFGAVDIDLVAIAKLKDNFNFHFFENAFAKEYSIEVQIPYLQYCLGDFQVVPLIVGNKINFREVADVIDKIIDDDTLVVVSTNFSHFLNAEEATAADEHTIQMLQSKDSLSIFKEGQASAIQALALLNEIALAKHWLPVFTHYSNSTAGGDDPDSVVGYASLLYLQE